MERRFFLLRYQKPEIWRFTYHPYIIFLRDMRPTLRVLISSTFAVTMGVIKADQAEPITFRSLSAVEFFSTKANRGDHSKTNDVGDRGKSVSEAKSTVSHNFTDVRYSLALSLPLAHIVRQSFSLPLSFSFVSPLSDVYATPVRPRKRWNSIDRSLYGRSQGGSKFHPESPMYSRLNVFLSNKRYSQRREREGMEEAGGGNISRYPWITKVTMQNDKSSEISQR